MDEIRISNLTCHAIIGVYPEERTTPQPVGVNVSIAADFSRAAASESLEQTIDYAALGGEIRFLLENGQFYLMESAITAITRYIAFRAAKSSLGSGRVQVELTKPQALGGLGLASLTCQIEHINTASEHTKFGHVDIIFESKNLGIYQLNIAPNSKIPMHYHRKTRECEMVLTDGLVLQGEPVPRGVSMTWPLNEPHEYLNPTSSWQAVLCIDSPPFRGDDEIETDRPPRVLPAKNYYETPTASKLGDS